MLSTIYGQKLVWSPDIMLTYILTCEWLCVNMAVQIRSNDQMTLTPHALPTTGRPLAGLRVVEVATFVAGPLGGMTLAQLGADVIRVDPPGGAADYTRWPGTASGTSLYWARLNKAKRSLCADFR